MTVEAYFRVNGAGNVFMIHGGRDYLIERASFQVARKRFCFNPDGSMTEQCKPGAFPVEIGDIIIITEAPAAEKIGKKNTVMIYSRYERNEIAAAFLVFNRVTDPPRKVIGSMQDGRDFGENAIEITLEKVDGSCTYCKEKAIDTCSICEKKLCTKHDIAAISTFPWYSLGYCEDCLYYLNLIETDGSVIA